MKRWMCDFIADMLYLKKEMQIQKFKFDINADLLD
jgi:hypothetical protein